MRATRFAGLLLAALLFTHAAAATIAVSDLSAGPGFSLLFAAAQSPAAASPPVPAAPAQRPAELEYLPRDDGRGGAAEIGWLLISAAIVLAIIIVVFVIRHRRTGRPG